MTATRKDPTVHRHTTAAAVLTAVYAATVIGANLLTQHYGLRPLPLGLLVPAGTWAAGLALIVRDLLQQAGGRWWVVAGIALGTAVSFATTAPALALASGVAFALSELADFAVYTRLRKHSVLAAVLVSGLVGAPIDTWLFLTLSPLGFSWPALAGQVLVKVVLLSPVALGATYLIRRRGERRALLQPAVHGTGA